MEARDLVERFDLRAPPDDFHDDPYRYYRALRETAPVLRSPDGGFLLTRYADCDAVYRDPALYSSDKRIEFKPKFGDGLLYEHHTTSLVFNDPPLHTRVRKILVGALSSRAIAAMTPRLEALVDRLLDAMAAKSGPVDLIEDFAAAIPVEVIGDLLGVPRDEREPLRDWSLAILGALEPAISPAQFDRGETAVADFLAYLEGLTADRRARPGDPETDVLTRLIEGDREGGRFSDRELMQNCIFILNAGHETTTNLIGNGLATLAAWPEEKARLIADPRLAAGAVEEMLRFESSNQLGNRISTAPSTIGGVETPAGARITLCIGAANRDPAAFADPERFDVSRSPNRHLAFAAGPHLCAGLHLARLEGRVAIERFLARFPAYRLDGPPTRGRRLRFRGYAALPAILS